MRYIRVLALCLTVFLGSLTLVTSSAYAASEEAVVENPEFAYFQMPPLMIPVINDSGLSQQVSFVVSIEVPFDELESVSMYEPRLADAYIQDLYGVLSAGYGLVSGQILNIPQIKDRLSQVTNSVLAHEEFKADILLQVVQQRPL